MDSNLVLLENVLRDSHRESGAPLRHAEADVKYVRVRYANERLPFLTTTLPSLGKAVLDGIETGCFKCPPAFACRKGQALPKFLQGLLKLLFRPNGLLLPGPRDSRVVKGTLMVTMLCYKMELPYKEESIQSVISSFVEDEADMRQWELPTDTHAQHVLSRARGLIHTIFQGFNPKEISPQHGPGSVATGEVLNSKYVFQRKYQRLHQEYPYYEYFSPSMGMLSFESGWYQKLQPTINPTAKVVLVPKDSRGPRLISMEPLEIQWIQQGLSKKFVKRVERHALTRGFINFTDQTINRALAKEASQRGHLATLDLKAASDRVPLKLVEYLFPEDLFNAMMACRSTCTTLPSGEVLPLYKFAPMGSALCFPVMATTLWALTQSILTLDPDDLDEREELHALPRSPRPATFVYGDDLIVPTDAAVRVFAELPHYGLKLNEQKSYTTGLFRESCGMDAYFGDQVTPVRLRAPLDQDALRSSRSRALVTKKSKARGPVHFTDSLRRIGSKRGLMPKAKAEFWAERSKVLRFVYHVNELSRAYYHNGYWESSVFLQTFLTGWLGSHKRPRPCKIKPDGEIIPEEDTSFEMFLLTCCGDGSHHSRKVVWDDDLQSLKRECLVTCTPVIRDRMSVHTRLLKDLANPSNMWRNPERVAASRSCFINLGWTT